jgi:hypothetical protein
MGAVLGFEYAPEYAEQVRRLFYGDAPGGPVPAGVILANDRQEWAVLRGEIPFQVANASAATAGVFNYVQLTTGGLTMPLRVAVITHLFVLGGIFKMGLLATPLTTVSSLRATTRDFRRASLVTFAGIGSQAGDPFASQPGFPATPAQGQFMPIPPYVLGLPSKASVQSALVVSAAVVATSVTVYAWGYERQLRPEEQLVD